MPKRYWTVPIPGAEDLVLCSDGGIAFHLPAELQRPIDPPGSTLYCQCQRLGCLPIPRWDTARVHPTSGTWTVHWPDLYTVGWSDAGTVFPPLVVLSQ